MTNTTNTTKTLLALGLAAVAAAAFAPSALAVDGVDTASDNSDVTATVGAEIAITATDPATMTLSHFSTGTSTGNVDVVSTQPAWTVSIKDTDAGSPGKLDRAALQTGPAALQNSVEYAPAGGSSSAVTASNQTVLISEANDAINVGFSQTLATGEDVIAGDDYSTTVQYSVAAN